MDLQLQGQAALVMASSRGLGRAVATQLAIEGCHVMITGRDATVLEQTRNEIAAQTSSKVAACVADMSKPEDISKLVADTLEQLGAINILINNSGGPPGGDFDQLDDAHWQSAFESTLLAYVRTIRTSLPALKKEGGRIINITSSSVKQPIPGLLLSNAFRMGMLGLGKSLANELAKDNVLVHTVAPGRVATDRTVYLDQLKADQRGVAIEQIREENQKLIPLGRYGKTDEFARVVTFLASPVCSYMTGDIIQVDGGMIKGY